jgi:hypothetical protein
VQALGGKDDADPQPFQVYLYAYAVPGTVDLRFINHGMTPDQARALGVLLIEAAALAEGVPASSTTAVDSPHHGQR